MEQMMVLLTIGQFALFVFLVGMVYRLTVAVERIARALEVSPDRKQGKDSEGWSG